jgi:hypothetical protein
MTDALGIIPPADVPPAEDAPRGRGRRRPADTRPSADRAPRAPRTRKKQTKTEVAKSAEGLHQLAGALILPGTGRPETGKAVLAIAADAGRLWAELAERYPLIGRLFTGGESGVLFVQLFMLYSPLLEVAKAEAEAKAKAKAKASGGSGT